MKYRKLGNSGIEVPALGFGTMRLPTTDGVPSSAHIDEEEAIKLIRYSIDHGANYVDTAYPYHGGLSENVVGKAMKDGYREKAILVSKAPMARIKTAAQYDAILEEQLKKLEVDCLDIYLFHSFNTANWEIFKSENLMERAEAAQKAGKIKHIGFSFHDSYELFEEIINYYDKWTMCQIQYNFIDIDYQAGTKGLKLAASKGIGVSIMEPLRGGKLAKPIPSVAKLLKEQNYPDSFANLSLQWLWNQPEVSIVLSGMTTMEQLEQNLVSADKSAPNSLSQGELDLVASIKTEYETRGGSIPCTKCAYCIPCPQNVNIPMMFTYYNDAEIYEDDLESIRGYNVFGRQAANCVGCKVCEDKCPQHIEISQWMPKIHDAFFKE